MSERAERPQSTREGWVLQGTWRGREIWSLQRHGLYQAHADPGGAGERGGDV